MNIAQSSKCITERPTFAKRQLKGSDFFGGVLKSPSTTVVEPCIAIIGSLLVSLFGIVAFRDVYSISAVRLEDSEGLNPLSSLADL